jgi:transcriptional regulator with PAS, ATPase and Fis domain
VDVRIIAATNRDLKKEVEAGRFREDLYFRLSVVTVSLPPLRERGEDIGMLANVFLRQNCQQYRRRMQFSPEALGAIAQYQWPGNIRELRAVLERANIYANYHGHPRIEKEDLPLELLSATTFEARRDQGRNLREGIELDAELARVELAYIEEALRLTEERKTEAWKLLGLNDRFALLRRVKSLLRAYPALGAEFATVQKLYSKEVG